MTQAVAKAPAKSEPKTSTPSQGWRPFESLRREIDRLFEEFDGGRRNFPSGRSLFGFEPFARDTGWGAVPAVDIAEKDAAYEVTAELPGLEEKNIDVKIVDGDLRIKGEKTEEKKEDKKGYYVRERTFGAFERRFRLPEGVDADKIEANFKKGLLTVTLPKKASARQAEKKIAIKSA